MTEPIQDYYRAVAYLVRIHPAAVTAVEMLQGHEGKPGAGLSLSRLYVALRFLESRHVVISGWSPPEIRHQGLTRQRVYWLNPISLDQARRSVDQKLGVLG